MVAGRRTAFIWFRTDRTLSLLLGPAEASSLSLEEESEGTHHCDRRLVYV